MQKSIKDTQSEIAEFVDARKWAETHHVYGIMLNMIEEIGEAWNVVKHLETDHKLLRKVMDENKGELEDFIGDISFLTYKLAHVMKVDVDKAVSDRLKEFEERFPAEFMKKHAFAGNRRAGGIDNKYPENKVAKKKK
ncbi:MAG: MazG-like family protein [bacterium]